MLDSSQSGVDGVGPPNIIRNSFAVRLKAKDIQVQKETSLTILGEQRKFNNFRFFSIKKNRFFLIF